MSWSEVTNSKGGQQASNLLAKKCIAGNITQHKCYSLASCLMVVPVDTAKGISKPVRHKSVIAGEIIQYKYHGQMVAVLGALQPGTGITVGSCLMVDPVHTVVGISKPVIFWYKTIIVREIIQHKYRGLFAAGRLMVYSTFAISVVNV